MFRTAMARWLQAPPVTGWLALAFGLAAVWLPTMIRLAVRGVVTGCEFTPYLPFVLICAMVLRWWQAAAVALTSVAILGGLFGGTPTFQASCFMPAAGIFLASSVVMIALAVVVRSAIAAIQKRGSDESSTGIVFSVEKGQVWASWYGQGLPVLLGSQRKVSAMMKDFLAHAEARDRLAD